MTSIEDVIQQYDDGSFGQFTIELEVYHGQVIQAVLLLQVVERGMGRTSQSIIAVYLHVITKIVGDVIGIASNTCLSRHRDNDHLFTVCLWYLGKEVGELAYGLIDGFTGSLLLHLMGQLT